MPIRYFLYFLLISNLSFSQKLSFIYETKFRYNSEKPNDYYEKNMLLEIDNNQSIFRDFDDKKIDSLQINNGRGMTKLGVENNYYVKKDFQSDSVHKIITYLGVNYLLPIDEKLQWIIKPEKTKLGKYAVQKAETNYGGRDWTAWFTTDLAFNDGPYIFHGLPGLIVSIQDSKNDFYFNLIQVKKYEDLFDARTKTVKIDWKKYESLARSYYNDPYDLLSKAGRKVTMTGPNGNVLDINEVAKEVQNDILQENNPIELNHKINYK